MPTYFPVAEDGRVTFNEFQCQQIVDQNGLTIESGVADSLVDLGFLRVGDPLDDTPSGNVLDPADLLDMGGRSYDPLSDTPEIVTPEMHAKMIAAEKKAAAKGKDDKPGGQAQPQGQASNSNDKG